MPEMTAKGIAFFILFGSLMWNPIFGQGTVYPFVHEEDHHVPVFENDQFRVLDVSASKGDTTQLHRHCNPILFITVKGTTVGLKEPDSKWKEVMLPTGWIGQDIYQNDSCFIHQFTVVGEESLQIAAIESLKDTDMTSLSLEPIHKDQGFSLYAVGEAQLSEVAEYDIPIVLIESVCDEKCKIEVISSSKLSEILLEKNRAYAVAYKSQL